MSVVTYPLLDMVRMSRHDCINWLQRNGYPIPPKSACIGCPFRKNSEWKTMVTEEFEDACNFDDQIRSFRRKGSTTNNIYLHRKCKPLIEVDFRSGDEKLEQQLFDFVKDEKLNLFVRNLEI